MCACARASRSIHDIPVPMETFRLAGAGAGGAEGSGRLDHLALMRYSARLMLAGVPVMVTWRSDEPSTGLAILI